MPDKTDNPELEFVRAIPDLYAQENDRKIFPMNVNDLEPHPHQPRKTFDPVLMRELEESIRDVGVLTPLVISVVNNRCYIVSGERRWRAAKAAGLRFVPCVLFETSMGKEILTASNRQTRLEVFEEFWMAWGHSLDFINAASGQTLSREEWANIVRYVVDPEKARVPPPPDWVLERYAWLRQELRQMFALQGLELEEMAAYLAAYQNLHPLVQEALQEGHLAWEPGRRMSAWIKKMRRALPDHPDLEDEVLAEFIREEGRRGDLVKTLEQERRRLLGQRSEPVQRTRMMAGLRQLRRNLRHILDPQQREEAEEMLRTAEQAFAALERVFGGYGVDPWVMRKRAG
jgi:ParB family chromosome partitioning protein